MMTRFISALVIVLSIFLPKVHNEFTWKETIKPKPNFPVYYSFFCKNQINLIATYTNTAPITYYLWINEIIQDGAEMTIRFDSEPTIKLVTHPSYPPILELKSEPDVINNIYTYVYTNVTKEHVPALMSVQGERPPHHPPYITSFKVNGEEKCLEPIMDYFGRGHLSVAEYYRDAPDKYCGRRKLSTEKTPTPLIVSGTSTNAGWWPWHAALSERRNGNTSYIGAGTLISKRLILTGAHCVTKNGEPVNPDVFVVALGKYRLFEDEKTAQIIEVKEIIFHENFNHKNLDNDIAVMKLSKEAEFNNYVQPACLWFDGIYDQLGTYAVSGVVVGWGFDKSDSVSNLLQITSISQVPDSTCIAYQPIFYSHVLNGKKFCAGSHNGIRSGTPCNGDSGGGFVVFVNDLPDIVNTLFTELGDAGAWYVKGIVSASLSREGGKICDPYGYTVFTDVAQYRDWILKYLNSDT